MSLHLETISERSIWDMFVLKYAPQSLFQSWIWGDVQMRLGSRVTRYGLYDGDTLKGVAQTVLVRARRGSFLHVRHGPIFTSFDPHYWKSMLSFITREAKIAGCYFVRISPLVPESDESHRLFATLGAIPAAIHRMDGEYCWVLDLDHSQDELLAGMRKTTRYDIRRGQREGVQVFSTTDPKYLSDFFDLYKATSSRHGFVPHSGVKEEFEVFAKAGQAILFIGKLKGTTIAAAIILYFGHQAIYHHGASIAFEVPVSPLVQWEAIQEAKKRGMKVYNFWGIAPENSPRHPWRGITLFKKGFGGREIRYAHAQDIPISPLYIIPRSIETLRRILRGYD